MIRSILLAALPMPAGLCSASPPPLPEALTGFGAAVCDGFVDVSPEGGMLYRIGADAKQWVECGKLAKSRHFHQLIVLDATHLMARGGTADGGPLADVEIVAADQISPAR